MPTIMEYAVFLIVNLALFMMGFVFISSRKKALNGGHDAAHDVVTNTLMKEEIEDEVSKVQNFVKSDIGLQRVGKAVAGVIRKVMDDKLNDFRYNRDFKCTSPSICRPGRKPGCLGCSKFVENVIIPVFAKKKEEKNKEKETTDKIEEKSAKGKKPGKKRAQKKKAEKDNLEGDAEEKPTEKPQYDIEWKFAVPADFCDPGRHHDNCSIGIARMLGVRIAVPEEIAKINSYEDFDVAFVLTIVRRTKLFDSDKYREFHDQVEKVLGIRNDLKHCTISGRVMKKKKGSNHDTYLGLVDSLHKHFPAIFTKQDLQEIEKELNKIKSMEIVNAQLMKETLASCVIELRRYGKIEELQSLPNKIEVVINEAKNSSALMKKYGPQIQQLETAIRDLSSCVQKGIQDIKTDTENIDTNVLVVKSEVTGVRNEVQQLKNKMDRLIKSTLPIDVPPTNPVTSKDNIRPAPGHTNIQDEEQDSTLMDTSNVSTNDFGPIQDSGNSQGSLSSTGAEEANNASEGAEDQQTAGDDPGNVVPAPGHTNIQDEEQDSTLMDTSNVSTNDFGPIQDGGNSQESLSSTGAEEANNASEGAEDQQTAGDDPGNVVPALNIEETTEVLSPSMQANSGTGDQLEFSGGGSMLQPSRGGSSSQPLQTAPTRGRLPPETKQEQPVSGRPRVPAQLQPAAGGLSQQPSPPGRPLVPTTQSGAAQRQPQAHNELKLKVTFRTNRLIHLSWDAGVKKHNLVDNPYKMCYQQVGAVYKTEVPVQDVFYTQRSLEIPGEKYKSVLLIPGRQYRFELEAELNDGHKLAGEVIVKLPEKGCHDSILDILDAPDLLKQLNLLVDPKVQLRRSIAAEFNVPRNVLEHIRMYAEPENRPYTEELLKRASEGKEPGDEKLQVCHLLKVVKNDGSSKEILHQLYEWHTGRGKGRCAVCTREWLGL